MPRTGRNSKCSGVSSPIPRDAQTSSRAKRFWCRVFSKINFKPFSVWTPDVPTWSVHSFRRVQTDTAKKENLKKVRVKTMRAFNKQANISLPEVRRSSSNSNRVELSYAILFDKICTFLWSHYVIQTPRIKFLFFFLNTFNFEHRSRQQPNDCLCLFGRERRFLKNLETLGQKKSWRTRRVLC